MFGKMIVDSSKRNHQSNERVPSWIQRQRVYSSILFRRTEEKKGTQEIEILEKVPSDVPGVIHIGEEVREVQVSDSIHGNGSHFSRNHENEFHIKTSSHLKDSYQDHPRKIEESLYRQKPRVEAPPSMRSKLLRSSTATSDGSHVHLRQAHSVPYAQSFPCKESPHRSHDQHSLMHNELSKSHVPSLGQHRTELYTRFQPDHEPRECNSDDRSNWPTSQGYDYEPPNYDSNYSALASNRQYDDQVNANSNHTLMQKSSIGSKNGESFKSSWMSSIAGDSLLFHNPNSHVSSRKPEERDYTSEDNIISRQSSPMSLSRQNIREIAGFSETSVSSTTLSSSSSENAVTVEVSPNGSTFKSYDFVKDGSTCTIKIKPKSSSYNVTKSRSSKSRSSSRGKNVTEKKKTRSSRRDYRHDYETYYDNDEDDMKGNDNQNNTAAAPEKQSGNSMRHDFEMIGGNRFGTGRANVKPPRYPNTRHHII